MDPGTGAQLPTPRDASSPLRIIALFIALSEALATAGALATDGTARMMLTVFAVVFPVAVLGVFVWLLVEHTSKQYAPGQYTAETTIEAFHAATRRHDRDTQLVVRRAVGQAVATAIASDAGATKASADEVRDQIVATFDRVVAASSVTVIRKLLLEQAEDLTIPVTVDTTVMELLDTVYFALSAVVKPFTYGSDWAFRRDDGVVMTDMGSIWARLEGREDDRRTLAEVGIEPGMTLTAIRLRRRESSVRQR